MKLLRSFISLFRRKERPTLLAYHIAAFNRQGRRE